jgi:serine phosphatase RsbU (regulator of sigma subunit)
MNLMQRSDGAHLMAKRLKLILGGLFFALMFVNVGANFYASWAGWIVFSERGWEATEVNGKAVIYTVDGKGGAAVLRAGDEIVSLKGEPQSAFPVLNRNECAVPPGTPYKLIVRRDGQTLEFDLTTARSPLSRLLYDLAVNFASLIALLTGAALFFLKPNDKLALLLALMLGTFTALFSGDDRLLSEWVRTLVQIARSLNLAFFAFFLHLFLLFPEAGPWAQRFPQRLRRVERWLYLPLAVGFALNLSNLFGIDGLLAKIPGARLVGRFVTVSLISYLVLGLAALAVNYRAADVRNKRRIRVVAAGCSLGILSLLLIIGGGILGLNKVYPKFFDLLSYAIGVTLPLIPLSFAYAIVRHQVIPVSLIIRRGVRYVLVSRGSVLIEGIVVALVVTAVLTYLFSRFNPPGIVIGLVSAAVAIAAWRIEKHLHEKYLAPIIDRKFFRQSYDSHQIISDLADSLRSTTDLSQLTGQVATKLQSALQAETVAVLLRDDATGDYRGDASCEYDAENGKAILSEQQFRLPRYAEVVAQLNEARQPIEVELNGSHSMEDDALRQMKSAMLLPLAGNDGMPGIISLGPRLGDLPYSREDKRLLMSVAGPTTFAIENARLVERMIEDARRREELEAENEARARELEEARQLQLSMLPKSLPRLPNLEIAAYMKTAAEVGGDYYDFHLSDDGALTVAVGDATGHGLKAGTMVTAMKSLFYSFADEPELPLAMNRSSRVLKRMNLRSLFMGLTVAKLDGHRLRITSAGMPPVWIYRAADRTIEEVFIKAMPLGSLANYNYREEEVAIAPGDVIVLMSDGFPERFNSAGEMFDYDRAKRALAEAAARSAPAIIEHFVAASEAWADGRPQDDDVTFVVLKVK